jgi:hypothetical protein
MAPEDLFSGGYLDATLASVSERVPEEIEQAPENHLLSVDEDAWVAALVERRRLGLPELGEPWMDPPEEVRIDLSRTPSGVFGRAPFSSSSAPTIPGFRVVVHIPFTGDGALFLMQPNSYTSTRPRAHVGQHELISVIEYADDTPVDVRVHTESLVREVEQYLGPVRDQVRAYNEGIETLAREAIRSRRERVRRNYEYLQATGIPMRRAEDASKTYISDVIVRRPAPLLPSTPDSEPMALEPVLGDHAFEEILRIVRSSGTSMERSPATYWEMVEEDLRQVVLMALNAGPFRGQTTAEAFNVSGRVDILIRDGDRNIFIAECKIWSGSKEFAEAIDHLFTYAAWRDTKLALIVFVRERDLTSIMEKARDTLEAHPQFVEDGPASSETELRAKMKWPAAMTAGSPISMSSSFTYHRRSSSSPADLYVRKSKDALPSTPGQPAT